MIKDLNISIDTILEWVIAAGVLWIMIRHFCGEIKTSIDLRRTKKLNEQLMSRIDKLEDEIEAKT